MQQKHFSFFFISCQTLLYFFVAKFSAAFVSVITLTAFMWHYDISKKILHKVTFLYLIWLLTSV